MQTCAALHLYPLHVHRFPFAARAAPAGPRARILAGGDPDHRIRSRRQYRAVQRDPYGPADAAAVSAAGRPDLGLEGFTGTESQRAGDVSGGLLHFSRTESFVLE